MTQEAAPPEAEAVDVLVVDDHRIFAEALASHLGRQPGIGRVEFALSLDEARVMLRSFAPGVVLLEQTVRGKRGTDLIAELPQTPAPPRFVVVSESTDSDEIIDALAAGVDGWVGKDSDGDQLMFALDEVLRGHLYLHPPARRPVVRRLLEQRADHRPPTFVNDLSPRELEVLRCLVAGLTRDQTARTLFVSPNTVRTHVQNLLRRADVHSTVALVAAARVAGVAPLDDPAGPRRPPDRMVRLT